MEDLTLKYLKEEIAEHGFITVKKVKPSERAYENELKIIYIGNQTVLAVDADGDEASHDHDDILGDYSAKEVEEEKVSPREFDFDADASFYESKKGEIAIVRKDSIADRALAENENYEIVEVK